jgi:hypothetical protein
MARSLLCECWGLTLFDWARFGRPSAGSLVDWSALCLIFRSDVVGFVVVVSFTGMVFVVPRGSALLALLPTAAPELRNVLSFICLRRAGRVLMRHARPAASLALRCPVCSSCPLTPLICCAACSVGLIPNQPLST